MAKLTVEIITGERVVYHQDDVDMVVAPGLGGTIGILPSHAALVSLLSQGELRVKKGGGEESLVVFGGFIEIINDRVIILADSAERTVEIDLARATQARQSAEEALRNRRDVIDLVEAEAALRRAALRERISQRRHGQVPG